MNAPKTTQAKRPNGMAADLSPETAVRCRNLLCPPQLVIVEGECLHCKQRLATAFHLFSKFSSDEGVAGHITACDPEHQDSFQVNPFGVYFS